MAYLMVAWDWVLVAAMSGLAIGFILGHQVGKREYGAARRRREAEQVAVAQFLATARLRRDA